MGLRQKTVWWVTCDVPGCPSVTGETQHPQQPWHTEQEAVRVGFREHPETEEWFCRDHRHLADIPVCPGPNCPMCTGEACSRCGAGCWNTNVHDCEHDVLERHEEPSP